MTLQARLIVASRKKFIGPGAYALLKALGVEFPRSVQFDSPPLLAHGAYGLVVHERTTLGSRVKLYQGVTIGRADVWRTSPAVGGRVVVEDHVVIGAGAVVLFRSGEDVVLRRGTVIGANSVITKSTEDYEIWAGNPARCVGRREAEPFDSTADVSK